MLLKEIRQAFRLLANNPGVTTIAALSLALGIGANSAIFSLTDALLLRPLPVLAPSEIVTLSTDTPHNSLGSFSYPDYRDVREQAQTLSGVTAFQFSSLGYANSATASPQMRLGMLVSDNFFNVLGVQPMLGRAFSADEGKVPGRDAIAVLGYDFWKNDFGRDPGVIGRTIRLNGIDFTIIGVTPEKFTGLDQFVRPALYAPVTMVNRLGASRTDALETRGDHGFQVKARLKPGISRQQAGAELAAIAKSLEKTYPDTNKNRGIVARTELQARIENSPPDAALAAMLSALAALVLLIACANVANILLARGRARSREIAIRLAIGAGRMRLVRQLLIESLMLALAGAALGLGFAYGGIKFLQTIRIPTDLPIVLSIELSPRVLIFSLLSALASGLVFGLAPAWQALKTDLIPALKSAGLTAVARRRTIGRNALVISQVALAMVLLVAAGMLLDGFRKALVLNPGYRTDHIMLTELDTSFARYSPDQSRDFYRDLMNRVRALPGVRKAALSLSVPLSPNQSNDVVVPEGYQFPKGQESASLFSTVVDEQYFETMKTPIVRGRAFTMNDKADSPRVAIVNEYFASTYWPNQDPIGKRIHLDGPNGPLLQVVGVAKQGRYLFIGEPPFPFLYLPYEQNRKTRMTVLAESYGDPAALAAPLREIVRSLNPNLPIYNARTLDSFYQQRAIAVPLMILQMVSVMGLLGLTLALIGLYGLIAYSVSRRTQEIGIRMALGAQRSNVAGMVLRQGFVLSIIGVAVGFVASVAVSGILTKGLVGLGTPSKATLLIVPVLLVLVTMAACYLPARRASQIDPIRALRYE